MAKEIRVNLGVPIHHLHCFLKILQVHQSFWQYGDWLKECRCCAQQSDRQLLPWAELQILMEFGGFDLLFRFGLKWESILNLAISWLILQCLVWPGQRTEI